MKNEFKAILVKEDVKQLDMLINEGWQVLHAFSHPKGGIFILKKT